LPLVYAVDNLKSAHAAQARSQASSNAVREEDLRKQRIPIPIAKDLLMQLGKFSPSVGIWYDQLLLVYGRIAFARNLPIAESVAAWVECVIGAHFHDCLAISSTLFPRQIAGLNFRARFGSFFASSFAFLRVKNLPLST
jgi:hypothetical protein